MSRIEAELSPQQELRQTDEVLLQLRIDTLRDNVLPAMMESPDFVKLNDWQQTAITTMSANLAPDQTIDLPTRSGKSFLIRRIAQACQKQGLRALIVAPRRHILHEHTKGLTTSDVPTTTLDFDIVADTDETAVKLISTQTIARNRHANPAANEDVDVVLIDEGHRALGEGTKEGFRALFPNAVRMAFSGSTEFVNTKRSVTDEYGEKLISHTIVEAIQEGKVPPVRAFLYKTSARIDNLDPNQPEFTARELRRLARLYARNKVIVDTAQDLVSQGRQGLVTTIPGENLLHADILAKQMAEREVTLPDGTTRHMRTRVVRGSDKDINEVQDDYEAGYIDIILYCDLFREGLTTKVASFLLNGRPTTSTVNLTQDIGRILEPKDGEMILVDFIDESVKQQCTVFDVLEMNYVKQGLAVGNPAATDSNINERSARDTYMRGLFRPSLVAQLQEQESRLISELYYQQVAEESSYQKRRADFERARIAELAKQTRIWEKILEKEHLEPIGDDTFMAVHTASLIPRLDDLDQPTGTYDIELPTRNHPGDMTPCDIIEQPQAVLPVLPLTLKELDRLHSTPRLMGENSEIDSITNHAELTDVVNKILDKELDAREAQVVRLHFGISPETGTRTLEEVGKEVGVTRERIRQLEARAFSKLRHPYRLDNFAHALKEPKYGQDPSFEAVERFRRAMALGISVPKLREQEAEAKEQSNADELPAPPNVEKNKAVMRDRDAYFDNLHQELAHIGATMWYEADAVNHVIKAVGAKERIGSYDYGKLNALIEELSEVRGAFEPESFQNSIQNFGAKWSYGIPTIDTEFSRARDREATRLHDMLIQARENIL